MAWLTIVSFFFLKNNIVTSIGFGELALLGPNLGTIIFDDNVIAAVSDGALTDLPILNSLTFSNNQASCSAILHDSNDVAPRLNCTCSSGYATDLRRPAFCGLMVLSFLRKSIKSHLCVSLPVNASVFAVCANALLSAASNMNSDLESPRISCAFPPGDPSTVTCSLVCVNNLVLQGHFTCLSTGFVNASKNIRCTDGKSIFAAPQPSSSSSSVGLAAGAGGGGATVVLCVILFFIFRSRRRSTASKASLQLSSIVSDNAWSNFIREYGHSVTDHRGIKYSFGLLQVSRKHVQLGREIDRNGVSVLFQGLLLPDKRQVAVRCHEYNDIDNQSAVLREAMVLHLFRHDNIVALLHVCRFAVTKSVAFF
jgi:hypothetical protein